MPESRAYALAAPAAALPVLGVVLLLAQGHGQLGSSGLSQARAAAALVQPVREASKAAAEKRAAVHMLEQVDAPKEVGAPVGNKVLVKMYMEVSTPLPLAPSQKPPGG